MFSGCINSFIGTSVKVPYKTNFRDSTVKLILLFNNSLEWKNYFGYIGCEGKVESSVNLFHDNFATVILNIIIQSERAVVIIIIFWFFLGTSLTYFGNNLIP